MNNQQLNVLIIEDNQFESELLSLIIGRMKHEPFVVSDYDSAKQAVRAVRFDVITVDIELGGPMNGIEIVLQLAQEFESSQFNPKVIVLTSQALTEAEKTDLLAKGIHKILNKPLRAEYLEEILPAQYHG